MTGAEIRSIWVCSDCAEELDRYEHVAKWETPDDHSDGEHNKDGRVGYDEFGLCVVCREVEAELGTGLFLENQEVDFVFTESGILFQTVIIT